MVSDLVERLKQFSSTLKSRADVGTFYGMPVVDMVDEAAAELTAARARIAELEADNERMRAALFDMRAGWRYIRSVHGDLAGVGWERCEQSSTAALGDRP